MHGLGSGLYCCTNFLHFSFVTTSFGVQATKKDYNLRVSFRKFKINTYSLYGTLRKNKVIVRKSESQNAGIILLME